MDLATLMTSGGVSTIVVIVGALVIRNKTKAETQNLVVESVNKVVQILRGEVDELSEKYAEVKKSNDDCEHAHKVTKLEVKQLLKLVDFSKIRKATLFILDDNPQVTMAFKRQFRDITSLDVRTFEGPPDFLQAAHRERPEIVILDYNLQDGMTAENVIEKLGYMPEVFIMSYDKEVQVLVEKKGVRFFYKGDHYVPQIVSAVMEHLLAKN